jgi:gluconolactonase
MRFLIHLLALSFVTIGLAQTPPQTGIVQKDAALNKLLAEDAKIEKVDGSFKFTEGPIWSKKEKCLLFSDVPANVIYQYQPGNAKAVVFMEKSGYTESDSLPTNNSGSNGLVFDKTGNLLICRQGNRDVAKLTPDKKTEIVTSHYQGKRLSSPNDVCIKSNGAVYFTDPPYALNKKTRLQEVPYNGVYRVFDGKVELMDSTLNRPNGVAFSPDEKYLYVNNTEKNAKIWKRYSVDKDGRVLGSSIFFDATAMEEPGMPDGFKIDKKGNMYAAGPGGMLILSPEGKLLGVVKIPEIMSNCAFGDADGKTLYITARTGLYKIRTLIPGDGF